MNYINGPLQIKGSDTSVRICDVNGKTLATINRSLGDKDYGTAMELVETFNVMRYGGNMIAEGRSEE